MLDDGADADADADVDPDPDPGPAPAPAPDLDPEADDDDDGGLLRLLGLSCVPRVVFKSGVMSEPRRSDDGGVQKDVDFLKYPLSDCLISVVWGSTWRRAEEFVECGNFGNVKKN